MAAVAVVAAEEAEEAVEVVEAEEGGERRYTSDVSRSVLMTPGSGEAAASKGGGGEEEATPGACGGRPTSPKEGRLCEKSTRRRARPGQGRGEEPIR